MRRRTNRGGAATVAVAAAVALAAGLTSPAVAEPESTGMVSAGEERSTRVASGAARLPSHHVTLITGDRVTVDAEGRVLGLRRAEGREHIPMQIRRTAGHTLVVPVDAARLITEGKVDQRLFDVTELSRAAIRKAHRNGLKVIVGYENDAPAATRHHVRDAGTVRRSLKGLRADAVQIPHRDTRDLWDAVSDGDATASGIAHVWLDGVRKATTDTSVSRIGAPTAWKAGYDGKGVKVAVLDTGVDATHPDLKSRVSAAKNFSSSPDATDKDGHGTHVASTVAGTGVKSGGKFKGVAPGAEILNGKVLGDDGSGDDSGVLAGMEWAVAQGADIINLSLGAPDTPGIDALEEAVNRLSAQSGVLFAIASGNYGANTLHTPGSADAALTVGAVDDKDALADFSSTGPREDDSAVKPDITAPGVDITAASAKGSAAAVEEGESPPGYVTMSGTSMATPHVAGAAALLKQQHPDWKYSELKAALTASAKGGGHTPFEEGSGRVRIEKAITQTVLAEPTSVNFGVRQWPHSDDTPVTKKMTYRNTSGRDVTLALAVRGTSPGGKPAPAGFFTLSAGKVTVPAGGTASVALTVDTRLGGTVDGSYSAVVTASGGGQSLRTVAAVQRETESYNVTVHHIGRDGRPAGQYSTLLQGYSGLGSGLVVGAPTDDTGTTTVRVPKGSYLLDTVIVKDLTTVEGGVDWLAQPRLNVTRNLTVSADARTTDAADITVPDAAARPTSATVGYTYGPSDSSFEINAASFTDVRLAQLGPDMSGGLSQTWSGQWSRGVSAEYSVATTSQVKRLQGDKVRHFKRGELATVKTAAGATATGKTGELTLSGNIGQGYVSGTVELDLPGRRTLYLSTADDIEWAMDFGQFDGAGAHRLPTAEVSYLGEMRRYAPKRIYGKTFNRTVIGPHLSQYDGVFRDGNIIQGRLPLIADDSGHDGMSAFTSVRTTLYRNGTTVATSGDPLLGQKEFKVPSGEAEYRLTSSVRRSAEVAASSIRIDVSFTFRSKKAAAGEVALPVSTVRFKANTTMDGQVTAGRTATVPVVVEGSAAGKNLRSLSVYASYDTGRTWKKLTVKNGKVTVRNPAKGRTISYRATVTDKKGNKSTVAIHNAYRGK